MAMRREVLYIALCVIVAVSCSPDEDCDGNTVQDHRTYAFVGAGCCNCLQRFDHGVECHKATPYRDMLRCKGRDCYTDPTYHANVRYICLKHSNGLTHEECMRIFFPFALDWSYINDGNANNIISGWYNTIEGSNASVVVHGRANDIRGSVGATIIGGELNTINSADYASITSGVGVVLDGALDAHTTASTHMTVLKSWRTPGIEHVLYRKEYTIKLNDHILIVDTHATIYFGNRDTIPDGMRITIRSVGERRDPSPCENTLAMYCPPSPPLGPALSCAKSNCKVDAWQKGFDEARVRNFVFHSDYNTWYEI